MACTIIPRDSPRWRVCFIPRVDGGAQALLRLAIVRLCAGREAVVGFAGAWPLVDLIVAA
jgi:hypothetical protein